MAFLKWKKPHRAGVQQTHSGVYRVEREPAGLYYWFAYRLDSDEPLTYEGFPTREEAKNYCEKDAKDLYAQNATKPICEVCGSPEGKPHRGSCPLGDAPGE